MKYEKAMVKIIRLGTEDIIATSGEEHTGCTCPWGSHTSYSANNWGGFVYKPQQNWFQRFFSFFWWRG